MPAADFKALRCQSPRLLVCGGEDHSWRWVRAVLREPTPATCRPPGRKRAPPHWPPPPDWRLILGIFMPPYQPLASQGIPAPSGRCRRNQHAGTPTPRPVPDFVPHTSRVRARWGVRICTEFPNRSRVRARWGVRICTDLCGDFMALEPPSPTSDTHTRMNWRYETWLTARRR